jgi:Helix-loop-helix DNA-binding domain
MTSTLNTLSVEPTWGEYDFTTLSQNPRNQLATSQHLDSQAAMDALGYLNIVMSGSEDRDPYSVPTIYQTGPSTLSDPQKMDFDASSSDLASPSTSRRHSDSIPKEVQTSPLSLPLPSEKVCPLIAGQALQCTPQLCGPDAACLDFSNPPDLEDCAAVCCITKELSDQPEFTQASQLRPIAMVDALPTRSSPSHSKKQSTRNSRQRLERVNSADANVKPHSKQPHSLVERRYRENLNGTIAQLHQALRQTKRVGSTTPQDKDEDSEEPPRQALSKVRKSDVMLEAVDYVHETEVELRHMADEIELLVTRVRQLEKLAKCEDCVLMKQLVNCTF